MAYNEELASRVRELLFQEENVEEKKMFGGLCFMVHEKMCIGVVKEELMCRLDPELANKLLEKQGCRPMDFTGKRMKGFVYVDETGLYTHEDLSHWVQLCLDFNPLAKSSKK